jgi:hypothetical protein
MANRHAAHHDQRPKERANEAELSSGRTHPNPIRCSGPSDNHPAVPQLNSLFGDHTFFLDSSGLNVLELTETPELESQTGKIVNLAYWSDADLTKLLPHEPEPTGVVVILEPMH